MRDPSPGAQAGAADPAPPASWAPWGPGEGTHFLQIIQQVHVQLVDVLACGDLDHRLFDVVLQLADDLGAARERTESAEAGRQGLGCRSCSPSPAPPLPRSPARREAPPLPRSPAAPPAASAAPPWWRLAGSAGQPTPAACSRASARAAAPGGSARCARSRGRRRTYAASPGPPGSATPQGLQRWELALPPTGSAAPFSGGCPGCGTEGSHLTSMVLRQCASLMGSSFPQALEMVHWSYCGAAAAAERGAGPLCVPLATSPPGIVPRLLLPCASPAARPQLLGPQEAERYRTPSGPFQHPCDGGVERRAQVSPM